MARVSDPMPDRDEESGRYVPDHEDSEFLEAIREKGGTAGTGEIADIVGCNRRTAYVRMNKLEDAGRVESRQAGNTLLWSLAPDDTADEETDRP